MVKLFESKDSYMGSIDKNAVKHVALLSRLVLDDGEVASYARELESILSYISKLNEVDTSSTPPTSHPLSSLKNVFRKDEPRGSLAVKDALVNAPSQERDMFRVPQVIEGR
jgi:aspartyl-tRNA(Asn)/glutamyl-tRNA(Gln) amidotransferase subunit C